MLYYCAPEGFMGNTRDIQKGPVYYIVYVSFYVIIIYILNIYIYVCVCMYVCICQNIEGLSLAQG